VHCEKAVKDIHPDILTIRPGDGKSKKEILVTQIREITADIHTLPNEAAHKVYIVDSADNMNPSAQNAFLKALEEPPGFVTFLLLAENPLALLPTVRSRCIHLPLVPAEQIAQGNDMGAHLALVEEFFTAFTAGGLSLLSFCVGLEKVDRPTLEAFVDTCYSRLAEALGQGKGDQKKLMAAVDLFDDLRRELRFHVSAGHISGKIAATFVSK
jgi:DNA polymerase-3 subunit delta'